ncbi:MAG: T4 RnlA family RNA ligase [Bacteroidota bacterium]
MLPKKLLQQMLDEGYVRVQKHPDATLWIYNYAAKSQYEQVWNEVTLQCRGLILDEKQEPIARPFPKFFNWGEQANQLIPKETFEVYEKMDGSLGILYWLKGKPFIATRGSFISEQSQVANRILHEKYAHSIPQLDDSKTYLFEIIYPDNRIVVDYGAMRDLVLLAVIDTKSAKEEVLPEIGFPLVKKYDGITDVEQLKELQEDNKEGFVIRFESGLRYKVKFEEYVRIHRIVTQVSSISIWEYLSTGQAFEEILENIPDEVYHWVKAKVKELKAQFQAIEDQCKTDFKILSTRKETAEYFKTRDYPGILFAMLDGKAYDARIWRLIRPAFEQPPVVGRIDK